MSDSKKALDRVRHFINLAASPNQKEAEAAAYKACALIRQHRFDVADPASINVIHKENATLKKQLAEKTVTLTDDDTVDFTRIGSSQGPAYVSGRYGYGQPQQNKYAPGGTHAAQATAKAPMTAPIAITSDFPGKCIQCSKAYEKGDRIQWQRQVGAWCGVTTCYQDWKDGVKPGVPGRVTVPNFDPLT